MTSNRSHKRIALLAILVSLFTCLLPMGVHAADNNDAQTDLAALRDKVEQAYANIDTYQSTVHFTLVQHGERWTLTQESDFFVAIDRLSKSYVIDGPDWTIGDNGTELLFTSVSAPGGYLALPSENLIYENTLMVLPFISDPALPDVVMMLSQDPLAVLLPAVGQQVYLAPSNEQPNPGIALVGQSGERMTFRFDPKTYLITSTTMAAPNPQLAKPTQIIFEMREVKTNQPIDQKALAFDVTGLTKHATVQSLARGGQGGTPGAARAGGGVQEPVPEISLVDMQGNDVAMADIKNDVIIMEFWATWCPYCAQSIGKLTEVQSWAKENKLPVSVLTVNVGETPEQINAYVKQHSITLPVLRDPQNVTADRMGLQAMPYTVIIHEDKIVHAQSGYHPQMDEQLQQLVKHLLEPDVQVEQVE